MTTDLFRGGRRILIVKTGAAGDVVRTTPLLRLFGDSEIHWLTAPENRALIGGKAITFDDPRALPIDTKYDLLVSLEEDFELLKCVFDRVRAGRVVGVTPQTDGSVSYTDSMAGWFDMSLVSRKGRAAANRLKLMNRASYQELLFQGLGASFGGEEYVLATPSLASQFQGDIAFAPEAGPRWPNKCWGLFDECIAHFSSRCRVSVLQRRPHLGEHIADIAAHRVIVSNDSLPMHLALGLGRRCVAFFTCTSPWEIFDYGRLTKLISPRLDQFFYDLGHDEAATTAIPLELAIRAIERALEASLARP